MKAFVKKCLAVVLTVAMVLSMVPASVFAVQNTGTYKKISSGADLTDGKYLLVSDAGYAAGNLDSGWLTATQVTPVNDSIENPAEQLIWNAAASGSSITLQAANGVYVAPKSETENGIKEGSYGWNVTENGDGTFTIAGISVTLAGNVGSGNKFRAYKNSSISGKPADYSTKFTIYKFEEGSIAPPTAADEPKASVTPGVVALGTQVSLSCSTPGATILYKLSQEASWEIYSAPITIDKATVIYAKAQAASLDDSTEVSFAYTIPTMTPEVSVDPITEIPQGAVSIAEVLKNPEMGAVTVVGQLVYRFGNNNNANSAIIEDVIDGQIVALQVYNSLDAYKIGDVLKITATAASYRQIPQLTKVTGVEVIQTADTADKIPAQEFATIGELLASKEYLLSEWVKLKNITLNSYNSNGSTRITDSQGTTIDIYKAATYPYGVEPGEVVDVYACFSSNNGTPQLRLGSSADYVVVNDTKAPGIELADAAAELHVPCTITAAIRDNVGVTEAKLTYTEKDKKQVELSMTQNPEDKVKWEATIPGEVFAAGVAAVEIKVTAKDAKGNSAEAAAVIQVVDEPQIEKVTPERNAITGDNKKPLVSVSCSNVGEKPAAKLTLKKGEAEIWKAVEMKYEKGVFSYQPVTDLADGRYMASVTVTRADGKSLTYEWPFTVGTPKYSLYFGQLHSHTTYSDGSGTLDSALEYINGISDTDNVDFVAFTDHSNYFDTKDAVNPEESLYDVSKMTADSQKLWKEYKTKVADFNASPDNKGVVALAGFEMTWSGGPGHINTFNTPGVVSRNNKTLNNKTNDAGMRAYYELLSRPEGEQSISQLNHPGTTFGTFSDFAYWDAIIDSRVNMVEVGNGEGAIGSGGYFPSYNYYTMALDKGWHVAPTNNQDNHKGKWGNANDARDVIITDSLTEESIYQAMRERRIYATEDKNLEINYTVNDNLMGSIIEEVPEKLIIKASLSDADDRIQKAELIANSGRVVHTWDVNAQSKELTLEIAPEYSYYYLRVTEGDGDLAVTAPVWVGKTIMLGISNVESSTSTPVTDETLAIKTTLFNSESEEAQVKSLTYKLDGAVLDTLTNVGTIAKSANFVHSYDFTPKKAKIQKITVEAVIGLGGTEYTYSKDLSLDVRDSNKLVYVGIDGSHYNEYVSGNYKDSMGNFSKMAAQSNVRCVTLNTSEDLIAAAENTNGKYKMLVLTAPSRRDGSALRNPYGVYSDAELEAIRKFSEAGGILVIGNWSDYYENYPGVEAMPKEEHMAAQQNKLLAAIGSKLRMSDDATMDDTLNGGQPQRLYFSSYNMEHSLMKGVEYDPENPNDNKYSQLFSQYGGSSIYAVDESGNPAKTLPENVSPIVYGHATTYSKDSDKDGIGGANIPKYAYGSGDDRLLILASETITHANGNQSLVLVGGAAFMSNFEIKMELDNNAEKNYSNYTILENLIHHLNPMEFTPIAEVQSQPEEGVVYNVEGIVTSNASGYDKDTAFFDCIYLQDETGGINAFPVAGDFRVGQKVQVTGITSSYQGERQLNVTSIKTVEDTITEVKPREVSAKEINEKAVLGSLVKLSGTVVSYDVVNGAVQTILVRDAKGETARVFIDGYITTGKEIADLAKGNHITVVGLASYDNTFDGLPARIRVRDRGDIVCKAAGGSSGGTTAPVVPEQKPQTEIEVEKTQDGAKVTIVSGTTEITKEKTQVKLEIQEELLKDLADSGNGKVELTLDKKVIEEALKEKADTAVEISLQIPAVEGVEVEGIVLTKEMMAAAKEQERVIAVQVEKDDISYEVKVPVSSLEKVTSKTKDMDINVSLEKDTKAAKKSIGVLTIGKEETLSVPVEIRIPVKETLSLKAGKKVYVYRRDEKGRLLEMPNSLNKVAKDGSLTISTSKGKELVLCTAKVKNAVKLTDRVLVSAKKTVKKGQTIKLSVKLPAELKKVTKFGKDVLVGQEKIKVKYSVSDKTMAAVSKAGTIRGKKKGTVKVKVTMLLQSGQEKTITKLITIK